MRRRQLMAGADTPDTDETKVDLRVRTARSRVRSSLSGTSSTLLLTSGWARLATHAAGLVRGKHKPTFAPHVDTGDFVIVVNAGKIALTGNKRKTKVAYRHSGYPAASSRPTTKSC